MKLSFHRILALLSIYSLLVTVFSFKTSSKFKQEVSKIFLKENFVIIDFY